MTKAKTGLLEKRGRKTVITAGVLRKLEEAFAWDCTDTEACFYAGIGKTALYEYQKDHPEFAERKEALKGNPILLARQTVVRNLQRDPDLALKYLERKRKDEFSPRTEIENITPTKVSITYIQPPHIDGTLNPVLPDAKAGSGVAETDRSDND